MCGEPQLRAISEYCSKFSEYCLKVLRVLFQVPQILHLREVFLHLTESAARRKKSCLVKCDAGTNAQRLGANNIFYRNNISKKPMILAT